MMNKHFSVILATVTGGIAALFTFYTALRLHNAGLFMATFLYGSTALKWYKQWKNGEDDSLLDFHLFEIKLQCKR